MATVFDVAKYILIAAGETSAMKLQKLVYYSQAWSLAWNERELFQERIEAWAGGPVAPALYDRHRGQFRISADILPDADENGLTPLERETVDRVISFYGSHTAQWLSDLTHLEQPWILARARACAGPGDFCKEQISIADMAEYYTGLMSNAAAQTVS